MPPIRILQVLGRLDRGGAETMIMNLYRHMDREKIQFDFVIHTEDECDYSKEILSLGGRIFNVKPFTVANSLIYRRQWRDFFIKHKGEYKVIHAHMRSTASIFLEEAKKAGLITIAHSHNTSSGSGISALVKNVLQKGIKNHSDYLFSCTYDAGVWLYGKDAVKRDNFIILKNGIEPEQFRFNNKTRDRIRNELLTDKDSIFILHVGRFEDQKNHRFLIEIFKELTVLEEKARLFLCGQGPLEHDIINLVKEYQLSESIEFLGVRTNINELMMASDLMIFPSLFEGLPVTLVEAQCTGLKVLMSDRVNSECRITDLITEMSLDNKAVAWAEKAIDVLSTGIMEERNTYPSIITKAGYDSIENAKWLMNFYLEAHNR